MHLTNSFERVFPPQVLEKYQWAETRDAAAVLAGTNPNEFNDLAQVLDEFVLTTDMLISPGGQESKVAWTLNHALRDRGWRETKIDTATEVTLTRFPLHEAGERRSTVEQRRIPSEGFKVDNFQGTVAVDVEWNAKDGNLDRDISAYRSWYDLGAITMATMITRTLADLRDLAVTLATQAGQSSKEARSRLGTTTTTNLTKLIPRLTRGDAGGCPVLAVAICPKTWHE